MKTELVILRTVRNAEDALKLALTMIEDQRSSGTLHKARYDEAYHHLVEAAESIAFGAKELPR